MMNVFILGSRGYSTHYGGWEALVHGLIDNWVDKSVNFYVFEIVHQQDQEEIINLGTVTCIRVFVKQTGSISMMIFDAKCTEIAIKYIIENKLNNPIMYYLGLRIGPLVFLRKHQFVKAGITILENPAGLEWKRTKWNSLVRLYTRIAAWFMAKSVDYLVCDSKAIMNVYDVMLNHPRKPILSYISYGSYPLSSLGEMPEKVKDYFSKHSITPYSYYLDVSRFVPENNYELIVSEFMKSKTKKDLVLVTNIDKEHDYFERFKKLIPFYGDTRIKFVGPMYDKDVLNYLRQYAYGYINGHSLGGTNPGLLESMSTTDLNLVFDVVFAREVGGDAVLYFNDSSSLSTLIDNCDTLSEPERSHYGALAKERMNRLYRWDFIVSEYEKLFQRIKDRNTSSIHHKEGTK